jgi:hypothetical protein
MSDHFFKQLSFRFFVVFLSLLLALPALPVMPASAAPQAAIGAITAWTNVYHSATAPGATTAAFAVPGGANRMLVVALSMENSGNSTLTLTNLTYGGVSLTAAGANDGGSSISAHAMLYYLPENVVMDGTAKTLAFTGVAPTSATMYNVWYTVYSGVDQTVTPGSQNYNSGNGGVTTAAFTTALTVNAGAQAVLVATAARANSAVTWNAAANWTKGNNQPNGTTGLGYVASRAVPGTNITDTASSTLTSARVSMTGLVLEAAKPFPTTVGVATALPYGSNQINVSMPYTNDGNASNTYTVEYKLASDTTWSNWVTGAAHLPSPYTTQITGLAAATSYDVRVTYIDADGVIGDNPQVISNVYTPDPFDAKSRFSGSANPLTQGFPVGSGSSLLVVSIVTSGTTARSGGAPSYNGIALTQADVNRVASESITELWYLTNPPTGSSYNISVPNTGSRTLYVIASSYKAQPGYAYAFDVSNGTTSTGSANPSVSVTTTSNGDLIVGAMGNGNLAVPTLNTTTSTGAEVLYSVPNSPSFSDNGAFAFQVLAGTYTLAWTVASDDWGFEVAAFKPVPLSTTTGAATATAASATSIVVSMPYSHDANANNTYTVEYKLAADSLWSNWVTAATHSASPYATTITGLAAATSYDIRVTYNDADGVNGANPQTIASVTTLAGGGGATTAWSMLYNGTAYPTSYLYTVPTGSPARALVVAVSTTLSTASAASTCSATYGGAALTKQVSDEATSARQHTWLFYLLENAVMNGAPQNLAFTCSGGTLQAATAWAAVYKGVDQTNPITASRNYNSGTTAVSTAAFATALTVNAGDQAISVINAVRGATASPTLTAAANWTASQSQTTGTPVFSRQQVADRAIPASDTTDASSTAISNASLASLSGLTLKTDQTAPVFSAVAPITDAYINNTSNASDVSYTLSEKLASGSITITHTGGSADPASPHLCALVGTALNAGTRANFDLTDTTNGCAVAHSLVDGGVYTFAFNGTDAAGNAASTVTRANVAFDTTAPTVTFDIQSGSDSGVSATDDLTNAADLVFDAIFSEAVTDFGEADLANLGAATGCAFALGTPAGNTYPVTVSGCSEGTVSLRLTASGVTDLAANPIAQTDAPAITIDRAAPTLTISAPDSAYAASGPVTYTVTYADANFDASTLAVGDLTLDKTGTADGTLSVTGSGLSYTVTVSGISGSGTLGISIAAGTASDLSGHLAPAAGPSATFQVFAVTSASLASDNNPSVYGAPVNFTATVTPGATGNVEFYAGATLLGTVALDGGSPNTALFSTSALDVPGSPHSITAKYLGDSAFAGSVSAPISQVVTPAIPVVTWPTPADISYGTALGAAQLNASTPVSGAFAYTPAVGTILDAGLGQTLSADFTSSDPNYTNVTGLTVTINVLPATPVITWPTPADISYGTALGATQLNASTPVSGAFAYTPAAGTILDAGLGQTLSADFTSSDPNYTNVTGLTVTINVLPITPTISVTNSPVTYNGMPQSAALSGSVAGTVSNLKYSGLSTVPTDAGTYAVTADFTPASSNYASLTGAAAGDFVINTVPLTVTADNQTLPAGSPDPAFTFYYSGFVGPDTAAVLTTQPACAVIPAHSSPGSYPITCSGGVDESYTFTYVPGTLTVTAVNNPPTDLSLSANTVLEGSAAGTLVGNLTTTDPDMGDTFIYTLLDSVTYPDNAAFQVSGSQLQTLATFAYQVKASYTIQIQTDDGHGGAFAKVFTITVTPLTFTISGKTGVGGVTLKYIDGSPKSVISDASGNYTLTVSNHWTGSVVPSRAGYAFTPASRPYTNVVANKTGQSYAAAKLLTFKSINTADGWTLESRRASKLGGTFNATATTLRLGDEKLDTQYKSILSFNTATLPDNAVIKSVTVRIRASGNPTGLNPFTALGSLLVDIRSGAFGTPALTASDFQAPASLLKAGTFSKTPVNKWYSARLSLASLKFVNKKGTTQLRLYFATPTNNNHKADFMPFSSGNATLYKPELIITYTVP